MNAPTLLHRRRLLGVAAAAGAAALTRPCWSAAQRLPAGGVLAFEIQGGGAVLGRHRVTFSRDGADLTVQTQMEIAFKLGPIPFVQYHHHALEIWSGDRFHSLETASNTNGHRQMVRARRNDSGVWIEPSEGAPFLADPGVLPLTHWNRKVMDAALFNPQDGKLLRERAVPKGADAVQLADGRTVSATRYSLTGETQIDDWYDRDGMWTALRGKIKGGSVLTYRRLDD